MRDTAHIIIKIERRRYVHFMCPCTPKMEIVSFDAPLRCPVCHLANPIRFGGREEREEITFDTVEYHDEFGDRVTTLLDWDRER